MMKCIKLEREQLKNWLELLEGGGLGMVMNRNGKTTIYPASSC